MQRGCLASPPRRLDVADDGPGGLDVIERMISKPHTRQASMMKSPLEHIPIELIEYISTSLEPCDIASLRLTSRAIENQVSHRSFAARFKHKNVELTTGTLQRMVQVTSRGHLGCLLQHCTITGIARDGTTTADESAEHLRLLAEAFRNLKQRSPKGGSRRAVWDAALRTFNVTMAALEESQLVVDEHLDIFGSLKGCSLVCDPFLAFSQKSASMHLFRSLKRLTLSLSVALKAKTEAEFEASDSEAKTEHLAETDAQVQTRYSSLVLQGILQMSRSMPHLESLDLHWYHLEGGRRSPSPVPSATRQESSTSSASINLKDCSLRGIYVSESDLLQFLEAVHPASLTLTDVYLVTGTYASIFKHLTSPESPVTFFHLDDIRVGTNLVHYDVPGRSKFPYLRGPIGPSSLTRQTSNVKEAIGHRLASGRTLGSDERHRWLRSRACEFGWPSFGRYDFIEQKSPPKIAVASNDLNKDNE